MSTHTHHHPAIDCQQLLTELNDYADGELSPELCVELEEHLAQCENCQVVLDTLKKTIYLVRSLRDQEEPLPPDVEQRLFAKMSLEDFLS